MRKILMIAAVATIAFVGTLAAQVRDLPYLVDAEWLADNLDVPELVVVQVDQRRDGYDAGHIPGAFFLPYERIAIEVDGLPVELPRVEELLLAFIDVGIVEDTYVVFYGAPLSAARAWMTADYMGLGDRAAILDGSIQGWEAAGLPMSTDPPEPRRGNASIFPHLDRIVDADWINARLDDPDIVLIDARPLDEYTGEDGGRDGEFLAGHIPGARHLYWEELMREDQRLLPEADLRSRFEAAGASPDKLVVVYCFIGMRASMAYFVSRMLGYETRLYDGSWHDWSARGLPVEAGPDPLVDGR